MFGCVTTQAQPQNPQQAQQPQVSKAIKYGSIAGILGGIAHAIIGGDTQQGLAIVGGSLLTGYVVGNEVDKKNQHVQYQQDKRVYQSQVNESYPNYGQPGNERRYNKGYNESYADGSPRTKYTKKIKLVTIDGETKTQETETIVSTKTEDVYYE